MTDSNGAHAEASEDTGSLAFEHPHNAKAGN